MFRDRDTDGSNQEPGGSAGQAEFRPAPVPADARRLEFLPLHQAPATGVPPTPAARGGNRKVAVLAAVLALVGAAGGFTGYRWLTVGRYVVSTDDAYVHANNTTLAAKVPGYVTSIAVEDNARVRAGDVIATLDRGDYQLAADAARGKVATQQATVARIGRQIEAQQAAVDQARAQLVSAEAGAKKSESDFERQQTLLSKEFASRAVFDQAEAARDQAVAAVDGAKAALDAAQAAGAVLQAQQQEASRTEAELQTALAKAERDLSFTEIRAPVDGIIGNRAVQVGDYMQPAQRLASLVPLDGVYVDANFKETQLARLVPGQPVSIAIDALPGRTITGTVASIAPASGALFSLLPPDNATGNFTKIVQRVPVRIAVAEGVAAEHLLRPGMSVVVSVDTKEQPSAAAMLADAQATKQP